MKLIDTTVYIDELRKLVEEGKEVCLTISGCSMSPFLVHRRDSIFLANLSVRLKKGIWFSINGRRVRM